MATRSTIAFENADGTILQIYCHFDGYLDGVGATLKKHYTDPDKIKALMALGSVSILAPSIECPEGHSYDNSVNGYTVFYNRDRGEDDCDVELHSSYNDWLLGYNMEEYNYIFRHDSQDWQVACKEDSVTFSCIKL